MPIIIPADLTVVTISGQQQRFTLQSAENLLQLASTIWQSRADISFRRASCEAVTETMPAGVRADVIDDGGYHYLASRYRAVNGVRVLFVDRTARADLGGQSRAQTLVCFIKYEPNDQAASRILAHELGHLLELHHLDNQAQAGPGNEARVASWMRNLMYSGALNPDAEINDTQRTTARSSALARRFGG
jgi:hypothetical protein